MPRDTLTEDTILPLVRDLRICWRVHAYGSIVSTNDTAKRLAVACAPEGTLVVAETQTGGHGRRGSTWESPPGGLWFSFVLRPHLQPDRASGLSVVAAVAVFQVDPFAQQGGDPVPSTDDGLGKLRKIDPKLISGV